MCLCKEDNVAYDRSVMISLSRPVSCCLCIIDAAMYAIDFIREHMFLHLRTTTAALEVKLSTTETLCCGGREGSADTDVR